VASDVVIKIAMEIADFDDRQQRWLQHALAAFLDIAPSNVQVRSIRSGSVDVVLRLPYAAAVRLRDAFASREESLIRYLVPLPVLSISVLAENQFTAELLGAREYDFLADLTIDNAAILSSLRRFCEQLQEDISQEGSRVGCVPWAFFTSHYLDGMTVGEVAQLYNTSRTAVRAAIYRVRKRIRQEVGSTSLGVRKGILAPGTWVEEQRPNKKVQRIPRPRRVRKR
jgi:hypothetical protein